MPKKPSKKAVVATGQEDDLLVQCQAVLGHAFKRPELLRSALTHASGAASRLASFERLEFLGDSILGMVACEALFHRFPDLQEGELTRFKSAVVSRHTCARLAGELDLMRFTILGKGFNTAQSQGSPNLLANVFESLIGAIYLDSGIDAARDFVMRQLGPEIERVASDGAGGNYKSMLQEKGQRDFGLTPQYVLLDEKGPDHSKCFQVAARIGETSYRPAWGRNKKEAEQRAAMNALAEVNGEPVPFDQD
jgi:ribonuclease-3